MAGSFKSNLLFSIEGIKSKENPSQSCWNDHEGVMTSPSSSTTAQSCLNFEMSIPTKYNWFPPLSVF